MFKKYSRLIITALFVLLVAQSSIAANRVELSTGYFPNPDKSRALPFAKIYVGIVDLDPEILANQKQISVLQESGAETPVPQPLLTNKGGVPVYNGSPVTILVDGSYSLKVLDKGGSQVYYIPKNAEATDANITVGTISDLRNTAGDFENQSVQVLGYYTPGDGGGGPLRIWTEGAAPGTYVDNGGSIIENGDGSSAWVTSDIHLTVREFGGVGDGVTDDYNSIVAFFAYIKIEADKLKSNIPSSTGRDVLLVADIGGVYASSNQIIIDDTDGVNIVGGSIIAIAGGNLTKQEALIKIQSCTNTHLNITVQCEFLSSGVEYFESGLFDIKTLVIYGCGKSEFGLRTGPLGWSSSGKISCNVFGWRTNSSDLNFGDRTADLVNIRNNDVMLYESHIAHGLKCITLEGGGIQVLGNHIWNGNLAEDPLGNRSVGIESLGDKSSIISGNYIDNCILYISPRHKTINNNWFLSGSGTTTLDACIVLFANSLTSTAFDVSIQGNRANGKYSQFILEDETPTGKFINTNRVLIKDNVLRVVTGAYGILRQTISTHKVFFTTSDLNVDNVLIVPIDEYVLFAGSNQRISASASFQDLSGVSTSTQNVLWARHDLALKQIAIKMSGTDGGEIVLYLDNSGNFLVQNI